MPIFPNSEEVECWRWKAGFTEVPRSNFKEVIVTPNTAKAAGETVEPQSQRNRA